MVRQVRPFLMFQNGQARAAAAFYAEALGAEIQQLEPFPPGAAPDGYVMRGLFTLAGLEVMFNDSPIRHGFDFTPSSSLFVECGSEAELGELAARLEQGGGAFLMPPGAYGFSRRLAWVNDRFGVSWQLNLA